VPPELVDGIVAQRRATDGSTSAVLQATYAAFLTNGDLDRHLRRMRRTYRTQRDAVVDALARWLPAGETSGVAAGLQVLVTLPDHLDEAEVVARSLAAGVRVYPLADYRARSTPRRAPAFVLGYGSIRPDQAERGIRRIAEAIADLL
jgi:GntR family transcriptional regulator/MocR family aminotransferase